MVECYNVKMRNARREVVERRQTMFRGGGISFHCIDSTIKQFNNNNKCDKKDERHFDAKKLILNKSKITGH